ncbi:4-hydroxy-tetrahydrodipicolinate reductase 1, chloroplastic-like isoform X2 [Papaver somniferum]|uniref:4-hydroxy-tetrahydrodipicolinate reductase 1, chloroplastic-like isoform X2 n=1 Tax=Papaver somniferum TaxID=3469 RepID=UPI000E704D87|nr:4-hydroxy-tetrahydrodipicolinate reductase 1, chloroplastic-like isoform X2 [Papaver somniferum]
MSSFSILKSPSKPLFFVSNQLEKQFSASDLHVSQFINGQQFHKPSISKPFTSTSSSINKKPITAITATQKNDKPLSSSSSSMSLSVSEENLAFPIMVNGCTGKMGKAIIEAGVSAGLQVVPVSFGSESKSGQIVEVGGKEIHIYGPSRRENILTSLLKENPNMIVIDFTVPATVNELYSKVGVPFVMGTTGGDREMLYNTVEKSKGYAVISPQMGKQVVAFIAAMDIMAEQFPGAFSGYSLEVIESHQSSKLDPSGTAKDVIKCFQKLGISYELDQMQQVRDPEQQLEMVGVPEEHLQGHAFHVYHLTSPDKTVSFEFQHNVCGTSIYAEGAIDAAIFLAKKVQSKADRHIYSMIDVLREGNMR